MSALDEVDQLISDYADGTLSAEEAKRLLSMLQDSDEVRMRLATASVTERLLRAMGQGAVPTAGILDAIRKDRASVAPSVQAATSHTSISVFWPLVLILVAGAVIAGVFFWPEKDEPLTVVKHPGVNPAQPPVDERVTPAKPPPVSIPALEPGARPVRLPAVSLYEPFPLTPPPPVNAADLNPPPGDGSDEAGFVAPILDWLNDPAALPPREPGQPEPPQLWAKIQMGTHEKWAVTTNDLHGLNAEIHTRIKLDYGMKVLKVAELSEDPARHPILFLTTHYHFVFTPEQRITLRRYLLNGGMIIFNAGLGSRPAVESARRELRIIFPEIPLERLGRDHPLLNAYYNLGQGSDTPDLEGLTLSCRTAAVISPVDMAAAWAGKKAPAHQMLEAELAMRVGINLFTYATSTRAWAKRSGASSYLDTEAPASDRMNIAQVMHPGEWRPRYTGLPMLLRSYNQRTEVPIKLRVKAVGLNDPQLFNHPLLYLTGHEPLELDAREIIALRQYLANGGFLFGEACCGRRAFDQSFRALMKQLFPDEPLTVIPADSDLFKSPNKIELLGVTQALGARQGSMLLPPRLEGIRIEGLYSVIYSPYGIAGGWENSPSPYANGYNDPDTLKLGQNILQYIIQN